MSGVKKKLSLAVVMLTISVLMLTSASFAWFTISTNPEVTDLTTQVVVNENLEIALAKTGAAAPTDSLAGDTVNQYTWGNMVDLGAAGAASVAYGTLDKTLRPAALDTTLKYPSYGLDGRVSTLADLTIGSMANGFGNLTGAGGKIYGYYVDFYLQTNNSGTVKLSAAANRSSSGEMGAGTTFTAMATGLESARSTLAKNIRIAFQPGAAGTITAATSDWAAGSTAAFTGDVAVLVANTPKLVRMYVYLDGATVTNAAASLADGLLGGTLNIQFDLASVGDSMDAVN